MDMVLPKVGPPQMWWTPSQREKALDEKATPYVYNALPAMHEHVPAGADMAASTPPNCHTLLEKAMRDAAHDPVISRDAGVDETCERYGFGSEDNHNRLDDIFESTPRQTLSNTMTRRLNTPTGLDRSAHLYQRDSRLQPSEGRRSSSASMGVRDDMLAEVLKPAVGSTRSAQSEFGPQHADASEFCLVYDPSPQAGLAGSAPIEHPCVDARAVLKMGDTTQAPLYAHATQNAACSSDVQEIPAEPSEMPNDQDHRRVARVTTKMMAMTYEEFLTIARASGHRVHAGHVSLLRAIIDVCAGMPLDVAASSRFVAPDALLNAVHSLHTASPIDVLQWLCEDPDKCLRGPPKAEVPIVLIELSPPDDLNVRQAEGLCLCAWREHARPSSDACSRSMWAEDSIESNAALSTDAAASSRHEKDDASVSPCRQSVIPRDATLLSAVEAPEETKSTRPAHAPNLAPEEQGASASRSAIPARNKQHQLVDPHTGQPAVAGTAGVITRRLFLSRRLVDPQTGRPVAAGTPGAISRACFDKKKLVDPQTGQRVAAGTPGAVTVNVLSRRRPVDPHNGKAVAMGTPGAIPAYLFCDSKPVDPQTGQRVAPGTPGAITWLKFKRQRPVDPRTGRAVSPGTPGAITATQFTSRTYVDPQTGCRVTAKTPGAIPRTVFLARHPVDSQTKAEGTATTPGADTVAGR